MADIEDTRSEAHRDRAARERQAKVAIALWQAGLFLAGAGVGLLAHARHAAEDQADEHYDALAVHEQAARARRGREDQDHGPDE